VALAEAVAAAVAEADCAGVAVPDAEARAVPCCGAGVDDEQPTTAAAQSTVAPRPAVRLRRGPVIAARVPKLQRHPVLMHLHQKDLTNA
jgi:hypothetical protein